MSKCSVELRGTLLILGGKTPEKVSPWHQYQTIKNDTLHRAVHLRFNGQTVMILAEQSDYEYAVLVFSVLWLNLVCCLLLSVISRGLWLRLGLCSPFCSLIFKELRRHRTG